MQAWRASERREEGAAARLGPRETGQEQACVVEKSAAFGCAAGCTLGRGSGPHAQRKTVGCGAGPKLSRGDLFILQTCLQILWKSVLNSNKHSTLKNNYAPACMHNMLLNL